MAKAQVAIAIGTLCLFAPMAESAEQRAIEEMVVTGSYIKRDNFDLASPMKVIDQDELKAEATPARGDVRADNL